MSRLINLHFSSEYSFFESPTSIKEYVEYAKTNNFSIIALTDHNYVFGYAEFKFYCQKNNIKSIFGIDLDVENARLILLAKNNRGFNEILNLSYIKSKNKDISIDDLNDENVYIINHPNLGFKDVSKLIHKFKDFYFYDETNENSNIFINDNRIVALEKEEALFFINKLKENNLNDFKNYLLSTEYDIKQHLIDKTIEIANNCNVTFDSDKNSLPDFSDNPTEYLKKIIYDNFRKMHNELSEFNIKNVEDQILYEFNVIKKMNVANYFLIITDLIKWAKDKQISIGPGRGSVSGSLVAYILGITNINPLKYNLYFERFLNEQRITMPDIDIDIQDDRREEVIEYLKNKYGHENVAQICTFQRMGAKQSLKDVGRFLNINFSEINDLSKLISGNDTLNESYEKNIKFQARINSSEEFIKLFDLATKIESLPRQTGIHAAGIVISKKPIIKNCPVLDVDNNLVTQFPMNYLEEWNLLKIDLLGLRTLTIINEIEKEVQNIYNPNFKLNQINFYDKKTNALLSSAKVAGIFQLESSGMIKTIEKIKINKFNDLVDIISLFRPGPMSNIPLYIYNKKNPSNIKSISSVYDEIVKETNGIIIYQEQIMEIVQKVAGLSFTQADIFRKAISKKDKNEMEYMKNLFIEGAKKNNFNTQVSNKIYEQIEKFAEYGFNKAHAVAYATISYTMAYLKARFPICFYSTIISLTASMDSVNKYVKEAKELKFNIESPMINKISHKIVHNKINTIWLPLTFIKGIGLSALDKLLIEFQRNGMFTSFFNFIARAKKINLHNSVIDILIESNTLREFSNMNTLINNKERALNYANAIQFIDSKTNEIMLDFSVKAPELKIYEQNLNLESRNEIKYLGAIYNAYITSKYETNDKLINLKIGIEYKIILLINKKQEITNKFKKMSYIITVSDSSNQEKIFFNAKNKEIFDQIKENTIGYANIVKLDRNGYSYFYISKWKEIA